MREHVINPHNPTGTDLPSNDHECRSCRGFRQVWGGRLRERHHNIGLCAGGETGQSQGGGGGVESGGSLRVVRIAVAVAAAAIMACGCPAAEGFMAPAAVTPLRVLHAGSSSFVNELSEDLSRDRSADLTKVPTTRGSSYLAQRSFEGSDTSLMALHGDPRGARGASPADSTAGVSGPLEMARETLGAGARRIREGLSTDQRTCQRTVQSPFYGPFSHSICPAPAAEYAPQGPAAGAARTARLDAVAPLNAHSAADSSSSSHGSFRGSSSGPFRPFAEMNQDQCPFSSAVFSSVTTPSGTTTQRLCSPSSLFAYSSSNSAAEDAGSSGTGTGPMPKATGNPGIAPLATARASDVVPLEAHRGSGGAGGDDGGPGPGSKTEPVLRGGMDSGSGLGSRPSALQWMERTLRGRETGGGGGAGRGLGFRRLGSERHVSSPGSGGGGRVEGSWDGEDGGSADNGNESEKELGAKNNRGWNLSGWSNEGRWGWATIEGARRNWSGSFRDRRVGGGPGLQWLRGSETNGIKDGKWGGRVPWAEKGSDLHIRTVAKIHSLLGREDQAEEMELNLIRDPYLLGDASWVPESVDETAEWRRLEAHKKRIGDKHLKDVMQDTERSLSLSAEYEGTILDFSRMNVSQLTMKLLMDFAKRQGLKEKISAMYNGEKINNTEDRAVLHVALRTNKNDPPIMVDGVNVVKQVHDTLDKVKVFSESVRSGRQRGATNKLLRNIVAVGIGGSYLGPEFVHEAFKTQEYAGREQAEQYRLRFLSNVDPVDVRRTLYDLDPEETLVVVISKTFTTAETMLNARTARQWLWDAMGKDPKVVQKHLAACASESALKRVVEFGIPTDRLFPLWDWVGGRYSVCSSVGALPLSLKYGFQQFENFLDGARSMDVHFKHAPFEKNLPVLMGLLGVWNISFMGYKTRTILPYAEALLKFPAHIQQLAMESNGKRVTRMGKRVQYDIGQVDFGEPGTNGQHSFFQLLHMGQICPAEFIGFIESQHPLHVEGEPICSHDELMANFFAQPDALAIGKGKEELMREGCRPDLIAHRTFDGNRPSLSLLVPKVMKNLLPTRFLQLTGSPSSTCRIAGTSATAPLPEPSLCSPVSAASTETHSQVTVNSYHLGQLLALYEHRTAVEGFMWDINSFDQWGVELGKSLATSVREKMQKFREDGQKTPVGVNPSTQRLMSRYLQQSDSFVKKVGNINHKSKNMVEGK